MAFDFINVCAHHTSNICKHMVEDLIDLYATVPFIWVTFSFINNIYI